MFLTFQFRGALLVKKISVNWSHTMASLGVPDAPKVMTQSWMKKNLVKLETTASLGVFLTLSYLWCNAGWKNPVKLETTMIPSSPSVTAHTQKKKICQFGDKDIVVLQLISGRKIFVKLEANDNLVLQLIPETKKIIKLETKDNLVLQLIPGTKKSSKLETKDDCHSAWPLNQLKFLHLGWSYEIQFRIFTQFLIFLFDIDFWEAYWLFQLVRRLERRSQGWIMSQKEGTHLAPRTNNELVHGQIHQ